jgi:hypothetical protein
VSTVYFPEASPTDAPGGVPGTTSELPTVLIDRIEPGQSMVRRLQVYFPTAGQHIVEARLPDDAVPFDNRRGCVVDFPADVPVLIVDGDPNQRNAYFLRSVFQPGSRARTGIRPTVQPPAFVRDLSQEGLDAFHAIYLLDVDRLDEATLPKINQYVRGGGGLAIFLGPNANLAFYNRWYADGKGLLPVALDRPDVLASLDDGPDLTVADHPLFRVLLGQRNPFVQDIRVDQYVRPARGWTPPDESTTRVLARLSNRQPLVVEQRFGDGRVVAFLTTLAPDWNNWARQPSFIVVALELQAYLDARQTTPGPRLVGMPITLELSVSDYRTEVPFVVPGVEAGQRQVVKRSASTGNKADAKRMTASLGPADESYGGVGPTDRSGVYEAWPQRLDALADVRRWSLNVDTRESDLAVVSPEALAEALEGIPIEIHQPEELMYAVTGPSGFRWSQILLVGLICLLVGEQALAYSASYHPARGATR